MNTLRFFMVPALVFSMALTPRLVQTAFAEAEGESAPKEQVDAVKRLANHGYLGDQKDFYSSDKWATPDQVTDALIKAYDTLSQVDLKTLKPGGGPYSLEDLQALLKLVTDKAEDIRARKASAWIFQNRIKKMIAALTPEEEEAVETPAPAEKNGAVSKASPTPIPGPSREEWEAVKGDLKDMAKKTGDLQETVDRKMELVQKNEEEMKAANKEIRASNSENQEQLRLVKRLLDRVQDDLKKMDDHLDLVEKKASEKAMTDLELQQELNIMHKDLRDNSQDVSILKQQVAKLDKSGADSAQSPLDTFLNSKVLAGGALLVGLTALVISLTRK